MTPRRRMLFGADPIKAIINAFKTRVAGDVGTTEAESCLNQSIVALKGIGLYDKSSLILTPNSYKASKQYSVKPTDGSGDLTFSRASTAMRRNSSGLWETVAANLPRLHYPVWGGCPAWLLEPQRTNDIIRSIELDSASWTKSAASVSANAAISPDGVQNADFIVEDATTNIHGVYQIKNITGAYTYSFFAKAGTRDKVAFLTNSVSSVDKYIYFDLTNLTVNNPAAGLTGTITDEGNGWRRISVSFSATGGTTYYFMQLISNSLSSAIYTGNGTSGIYMWQGQLEAGAYATSPIITAGSAVTRIKDASQTTLSTSLIGQTEGTLYAEFTTGSTIANALICSINLSPGNVIAITLDSGRLYGFIIASSSSYDRSIVGAINTKYKIALTYKSGGSYLYINGALVGTKITNSLTFGAALNSLNLSDGTVFSTDVAVKNTGLVMNYTTALTEAECIALTTL